MAAPKLPKAMCAGEFFYITHDSPDDVWKVVCFVFVPQGLKSEGLYRISGFSDSVEEVKMAFDKGMRAFGSACLNCFIDFCQLTTRWLTLRAFICLHKARGTFPINEKVTHLRRITVHLGVQILSWHVPLTQGFTVWTDTGGGGVGTSGETNHGCTLTALNIAVKKTLFCCVGIQ